jgi:hypothetical protein
MLSAHLLLSHQARVPGSVSMWAVGQVVVLVVGHHRGHLVLGNACSEGGCMSNDS